MKNPRWCLVGIIALAIVARGWLLWSTPWMPGMNGAYYLVQARAVLERGTLGIPDMPLTFYLQASVAWLLATLGRSSRADAILLGVKLCDACLPPLAAWPVFVLTDRWARTLGRGAGLPLMAAALAALGFPLLMMVGDFEKNALALVWLAALCLALEAWLEAPARGTGVRLLLCLALLGLTHIGVLGTALVLTGSVLVAALALRGLGQWRTRILWLTGGAVVLALAAALVMWKFDPARISRLMGALVNPGGFSNDGMQMPGPGPGRGGPMLLLRFAPAALFALLVLPALVLAYRRRKTGVSSQAAVAAGCALTVLAITGPWFSMDKTMRFDLIAFIPAVLGGTYALLHVATPRRRGVAAALALLIFAGGAIPPLLHGGRPILSEATLHELAGLTPQIAAPEHTLIVTRHGAEWWAAWFLHTHIAHANTLRAADWKNFDVLYLQVKSGFGGPGGHDRGPGPGGFFGGPPGPPPFGGPPGMGPPGGPDDRSGGPPAGGPMMDAPIPADARILHEGPNLKLARVATPPESVVAQR